MKVNPLLVLGILLIVLLIAVVKTSGKNQQLHQTNTDLYELKSRAIQLDALKQSWENRGNAMKKIDAILQHSSLKGVNIEKKQKKEAYSLHIPLIDKKGLDHLTGKLFNETLIIKSFDLTRLDDVNASLDVEIGL